MFDSRGLLLCRNNLVLKSFDNIIEMRHLCFPFDEAGGRAALFYSTLIANRLLTLSKISLSSSLTVQFGLAWP